MILVRELPNSGVPKFPLLNARDSKSVSTFDPTTYLMVTTVLIAPAVLASYVQSRRAATVDPFETLRAE